MTRLGKIARMPYEIREQLNHRLLDGEQGASLLDWLNALPAVKAVLEADFGGREVSKQNLSEWKQGGFEDWRGERETAAWARTLKETARGLEEATEGTPLVELLNGQLVVALGKLLQAAQRQEDGPQQQEAVLSVAKQITKLYRGAQSAEKVKLERERWEAEQEKEREKQREQAEWEEQVEKIMEECSLDLDDLDDLVDDDDGLTRMETDQGQSKRVKPSQTESNQFFAQGGHKMKHETRLRERPRGEGGNHEEHEEERKENSYKDHKEPKEEHSPEPEPVK